MSHLKFKSTTIENNRAVEKMKVSDGNGKFSFYFVHQKMWLISNVPGEIIDDGREWPVCVDVVNIYFWSEYFLSFLLLCWRKWWNENLLHPFIWMCRKSWSNSSKKESIINQWTTAVQFILHEHDQVSENPGSFGEFNCCRFEKTKMANNSILFFQLIHSLFCLLFNRDSLDK